MALPRVLNVPLEASDERYVLVSITKNGNKDLDLKLVATEGEAPYVFELKHTRIQRLQADKIPCSDDEWETVLRVLLLGQELDQVSEVHRSTASEVYLSAALRSNKAVTIAIKRRKSGISQNLGSIELKYDGDQGIELFEWCGQACAAVDQLRKTIADLQRSLSEATDQVDDYKMQQKILIEAKDQHDMTWLEDFRDLLNAKKVRNRAYYHLLRTSGALKSDEEDEAQAEDEPMEDAPAPKASAKSKGMAKAASKTAPKTKSNGANKNSARGKRKAVVFEPEGEYEEDDKEPEESEAAIEEERETDDEATQSEADEDENDAEPTPPPKPAPKGKGTTTKSKASASQSQSIAQAADEDEEMPAARSLPFVKPRALTAKAAPAKSDSETDDEL